MAVVTVLVLAVAGGGVAYWWLHGRGGKSTDPSASSGSGWTKAWANGYEQVWALDPPDKSPGRGARVSIEHVGDTFIRAVAEDAKVHVEVFSLANGAPEPLWEEDFESEDEYYVVRVWQGRLIAGDKLIDLGSQKREDAPWGAGASVSLKGDNVISCDGATCTMWSPSKQQVWQEELPFDDPGQVYVSSRIDHYATAWTHRGRDTQYLVLDLDTGKTKELEGASSNSSPIDLQDGWMLYDSQNPSSGQPDKVTLFNPDGSLKETFEVGVPEDFTDYPWSPQTFTLDQARAWLKDGDTSWAPATYSLNKDDKECRSITVAGQRIELGENNSLSSKFSGGCFGVPIQGVYESGSGEIGVFLERNGESESLLHLVDMSTGKSPEPLSLGDWGGYEPEGDFLITYEDSGAVKAYRPA
ncbi:hypothetical protein E4J66_06870 [Actinomyces viscosus]|uniref:hypothetical protein n=1 Tax=Actinomyces viscosus TaxID=1656 RepID=UPI000F82BA6F|nr:hypothetical protein [Actinomyces viscosus]TFH52650.1 hypothetical protein E4J66_06870 [Actinomyces viscosus]